MPLIDINISSTIPQRPLLDWMRSSLAITMHARSLQSARRSYNGWYYTEQAVRTLPIDRAKRHNGVPGHVDDKNAPHEFKDVAVVRWERSTTRKRRRMRGYVNPKGQT